MTQNMELEALVHRLEVSGADRTRWPAQERLRFAPLLTHGDAKRLLAEASALDRLLDQAPLPDQGSFGALVDRIVAAAEKEGLGADATVVRFDPARRSAPAAVSPTLRHRSTWQAAALLAASLVLGIFVGTSGLLRSSVGTFTQAGMDLDIDSADATELVLDGNRVSLLGEDVL